MVYYLIISENPTNQGDENVKDLSPIESDQELDFQSHNEREKGCNIIHDDSSLEPDSTDDIYDVTSDLLDTYEDFFDDVIPRWRSGEKSVKGNGHDSSSRGGRTHGRKDGGKSKRGPRRRRKMLKWGRKYSG